MKSLPLAVIVASAICSPLGPAFGQTVEDPKDFLLDTVYQSIENQPNLTVAQKYEQKMELLNATLEAGDTYTSAFEDLITYTEIARETGALFLPGFGKKLEEFQGRLEEATKNRAFTTFGKVKLASDYAAQAVGLISEADAILSDRNLTPSARRSLLALRGLGTAMQTFGGKVPGLGAGLETLGTLTTELTGAVRQAAQNVTVLKGDGFSGSEQQALGLGPGYVRTRLYGPDFPLVQELINERTGERTLMKTEDGWIEVPYEDVTAIWSEYRFVNGEAPSPADVVGYLKSPDLRNKLSRSARFRAEDRHTDALMKELGISGMTRTGLRRAQEDVQNTLRRLGLIVPPNSSGFKNLLKDHLKDPRGNDDILKRLALSAHPNAREYLASRGLDPGKLSLEELARRLIEYRTGGYRKYAESLRTARPTPVTATPTKPAATTLSWADILERAIARVQNERKPAAVSPTKQPPSDDAALKLAACYKAEQDYYQAAVDWFPKIHDKNAFSHWAPDPQHSAQEVPPKACSDAYYATRNNPGMWEKAWDILQECGWKAEIQKRKEALEEKKALCAQTPAKP